MPSNPFNKKQKYRKLSQESVFEYSIRSSSAESNGGENIQGTVNTARIVPPNVISAVKIEAEEDSSLSDVKHCSLKRRGGLVACQIQNDVQRLKYSLLVQNLESCNI